MNRAVKIEEFLKSPRDSIVLDARSENEFEKGHIPGAINLPLLNNEHRHLVGTEYKRNGRENAVLLGFELAGPTFGNLIRKTADFLKEKKSFKKKVLIYCWRGGMRSSILCWILELAGYHVIRLEGGYKAYRKYINSLFEIPFKILIIGGKTGSGKTRIIEALNFEGFQTINLEELASHRGSAYGSLGFNGQPTTEQFENLLGMELHHLNIEKLLFIENESRMIGKVKIPDPFYLSMRNAEVLETNIGRELRVINILADYGNFSKTELIECTKKVEKRLGNLRMNEAIACIQEDKLNLWVEILLVYYDKMYDYSKTTRSPETIIDLGSPEESGSNEASIQTNIKQIKKILNDRFKQYC